MKRAEVKNIAAGNGCADQNLINDIKHISMLHHETLRVLWEFAARTSGPILELGPYIGGSTTAMALGAKSRRGDIVTVEAGGSYTTQPFLPSADILGDLDANLRRFGVRDQVTIVNGWIQSPESFAAVEKALGGRKAGLIFIDSDGAVADYFPQYSRFLTDDAFVVLDDYETDQAAGKEVLVQQFVADSLRDGSLENLGVYQWGTFVGRRAQPSLLRRAAGSFAASLGINVKIPLLADNRA